MLSLFNQAISLSFVSAEKYDSISKSLHNGFPALLVYKEFVFELP